MGNSRWTLILGRQKKRIPTISLNYFGAAFLTFYSFHSANRFLETIFGDDDHVSAAHRLSVLQTILLNESRQGNLFPLRS